MTANTRLLEALSALPGVRASHDEPLAPYTTWKLGGHADLLIEVEIASSLPAVLVELADANIPWAVLGNGSNVLIADAGFRGAILRLTGHLAEVRLDRHAFGENRHRVTAGGGASLTKLLRLTKEEALSGLWVLGGIPGTVGGAVRMNAGTRWGEVKDTLVEVQVATVNGLTTLPASTLGLAYRHSALPSQAIVTAASFSVTDAPTEMRDKLDEVLQHRKSTQPLQYPSCGSVFANPPGDSAGRLIEACGLKGHRIGNLAVAEQHANWILNLGGGTARDAVALIEYIRETVANRFGIYLRPEVIKLGDFDATPQEAP
jgi:UDP-N-acetylmuramate dehydrogenase